jgi:hypothetical protein
MRRIALVVTALATVSVLSGVRAPASHAGDCFKVAAGEPGRWSDTSCSNPNGTLTFIEGNTPGRTINNGLICVETKIAEQGVYKNPNCTSSLTAPHLYIRVMPLVGKWLADGLEITEALAVEIESEVEVADLSTSFGTASILCSYILDGTVGPSEKDEITEVLNLAKEKIGELGGLALLGTGAGSDCKTVSGCAEGTAASPIEMWPRNLPWSTQVELMVEGEPEFLDDIFKNSETLFPGWEILCLVLGINTEDTCEEPTNAKLENTVESDVLETFNLESQKVTCTLGGAESGDQNGTGLVLLTSGKALAVSG